MKIFGKEVKTVFLDVDGTITDSVNFLVEDWHYRLAKFGICLNRQEICRQVGSSGIWFDSLIKSKGKAASRDAMLKLPSRGNWSDIKTLGGIKELIDCLFKNKVQLVIFSNGGAKGITQMLVNRNLWREGIIIVGGADCGMLKPDPELMKSALAQSSANPAKSLMIGDSMVDISVAASAGVPCIIVGTGGLPQQEALYNGAFEYAHDFLDLSGRMMKETPDHVYLDTEETKIYGKDSECLWTFAVLGDLHYFDHKYDRSINPLTPDAERYLWMRKNLLPEIMRIIKGLNPDCVISTGDVVEGCGDDQKGGKKEWQSFINNFLVPLDRPFYSAIGTHEGRECFMKGLRPVYEQCNSEKTYYSIGKGKNKLIFLDYNDFGDEQAKWLEDELDNAAKDLSVFIFSHAPLFLVARAFFSNSGYQAEAKKILASRKIDAFFCGHTHNQAVTLHHLGKTDLFQIKASSVGYPSRPICRLEERENLLVPGPDRYYWGVPEDNAPGLWQVKVYSGRIEYYWWAVNHGLQSLFIEDRQNHSYHLKKYPAFIHQDEISSEDLYQIKSASVVFMSTGKPGDMADISFNGKIIGRIPLQNSWAARREIVLAKEDLCLLKKGNIIKADIKGGLNGVAIGDIQLKMEFQHREAGCSEVAKEIYCTSDLLDEYRSLSNVNGMKIIKGKSVVWKIRLYAR